MDERLSAIIGKRLDNVLKEARLGQNNVLNRIIKINSDPNTIAKIDIDKTLEKKVPVFIKSDTDDKSKEYAKNFKANRKNRYKGAFSLLQSLNYYRSLEKQISDFILSGGREDLAYIINNYRFICDKLYNRYDLKDKAVTTVKDFGVFDMVTHVIRLFPSIILIFADIAEKPDDEIAAICDSRELQDPQGPNQGDFGYNQSVGYCVDPKYRYIVNDNTGKILEANKNPTDANWDRRINGQMFFSLSAQARWGNDWMQLLSLIFYRQVRVETGEYLYGLDLKPVQTILYLLKRYEVLPYHLSDTGKTVLEENLNIKGFFTSLPTVIYSMMELSAAQIGGNIKGLELLGAIKLRLNAAKTSFGTEMLKVKSRYVDIIKLLFDKVSNHVRVTYYSKYCDNPKLTEYAKFSEIWHSLEEKKSLEDVLKGLDQDFQEFVHRSIKTITTSDSILNTENLRYACIVCHIYGNPGIYYKTSLLLEAQASILPQVNTVITPPKPVEFINEIGGSIPIKYDWSTTDIHIKKLVEKYKSKLGLIESDLANANFTEFFVEILTNNSQGIKVDLSSLGVSEVKGEDDSSRIRVEVLSRLSNSRLIAFLLDQEAYTSFDKYLSELERDGLCTIRFQNNRRSRVVEIVPNIEQTAYSILLYAFEKLKKHMSSIAVGKQKGSVIDMVESLFSTGDPMFINNASDVSGMDAATQPVVYKLQAQAFVEWFKEKEFQLKPYFSCPGGVVDVYDASGNYIRSDQLSGVLRNMLYNMFTKNNGKKFELKDGFFSKVLPIANTFFASGQYDTTSEHTMILACIAELVLEDFKTIQPNQSLVMSSSSFGDDGRKMYQVAGNSDEQATVVQKLIQLERQYMKAFGYELTIFISRMYTDFLQQAALCGVAVPKSARSSIYCDERGETRSRDVMAAFSIMKSVLEAAAQRYYLIENVQSMIIGIWLVIRAFVIRRTEIHQFKLPEWKGYVFAVGKDRVLVIIPFITSLLPPFNMPFGYIVYDNTTIFHGRATTTVAGDSGWIWLLNSIFTNEDWDSLTTVFKTPVEHALTLRPGEYLIRPTNLFLSKPVVFDARIRLGLEISRYNRAQSLSKRREEALAFDIAELATKYNSYKDQKKLQASAEASFTLSQQFDFHLPSSLTYFGRSEAKIKQAAATVNESSGDLDNSSYDLMLFMTSITHGLNKKFQDAVDKYSIHVNFIEGSTWPNMQPNVGDFRLPILPGYKITSDYGKVMSVAGNAIQAGGRLSKLPWQGTSARDKAKYDFERAAEYVSRAKSRGDDVYHLTIEALGLSIEDQQILEDLIMATPAAVKNFEYSSQFAPNKYFAISGLTDEFSNVYKVENGSFPQISTLLSMMVRDIYFMFINISQLAMVNIL